MRLLITLACTMGLAMVAASSRADDGPSDDQAVGSLVIIGGSERFDMKEYWEEIVSLAGGPGSKIAVLPTANGDPIKKGGWVVSALNKAGADAFVVPLAWRKVTQPPSEIAADPEWVHRVREATGVFMIGGEQERIVKALQSPEGRPTPMLEAMWHVYRRGGVIAGTSAGAAVMSRIMFRDTESVLQTLQTGVRMGKELDRGLGFIDSEWFVDQHLLVRGRFARAIVAMHDQKFKYGIGVDENSAVIVRGGSDVKVIGYKGALVFDLSHVEHDESLGKFNLKNVRLTYLDRGDRFNLKTFEVTPSAEKLEDEKLDPTSENFRPFYKRKMFYNDILSNTTVVDLMGRLIDSVHSEAIGLAFDGDQARSESVDGFEFRFTRDDNSLGWYTEAFGGDDYTVLNIRLDIRPIRITGPLYQIGE
ncbi:MAG: cyanophycinase [Planctomycetaceae bacterium]|nr:cyanophycinase [Planctomycetaceae bacterium]